MNAESAHKPSVSWKTTLLIIVLLVAAFAGLTLWEKFKTEHAVAKKATVPGESASVVAVDNRVKAPESPAQADAPMTARGKENMALWIEDTKKLIAAENEIEQLKAKIARMEKETYPMADVDKRIAEDDNLIKNSYDKTEVDALLAKYKRTLTAYKKNVADWDNAYQQLDAAYNDLARQFNLAVRQNSSAASLRQANELNAVNALNNIDYELHRMNFQR